MHVSIKSNDGPEDASSIAVSKKRLNTYLFKQAYVHV